VKSESLAAHNPYELQQLPFFNARRLMHWFGPNRYWRLYARLAQKPFDRFLDRHSCKHFSLDRGAVLENTAVTANQLDLLLKAVAETESLGGSIAEIGCYFGSTTRTMAQRTARQIFAVDPYSGWDGADAAFVKFSAATAGLPNVKHLRQSSGAGAQALAGQPLNLVFIDAVHDYLNTWYDFIVWSELVVPGGLVAFHDVDDWRGTNVACQKILERRKDFVAWGYCPNLVIFRKV
jgi:predicted O-methyltransferase YrrM